MVPEALLSEEEAHIISFSSDTLDRTLFSHFFEKNLGLVFILDLVTGVVLMQK